MLRECIPTGECTLIYRNVVLIPMFVVLYHLHIVCSFKFVLLLCDTEEVVRCSIASHLCWFVANKDTFNTEAVRDIHKE